jgi:NAD(P)-dependent dehydrogenase (short-subunit alcohol dehydrogenase family)
VTLQTTFSGQTGVITGGSSGIGRAAALMLAARGADLAVASTDETSGHAVVEEIKRLGQRGLFVRADVSEPSDVRILIEKAEETLGPLRFLYASAGIGATGTAETTTPEQWRRVIDVNLTGSFLLAKFGIAALRRAGGGSILLTGSDLGLVGATQSVAYCAAKGGVVNLTRALALDCARLGIRVNCIAPGSTQTPMLEHWFDKSPDPAAEMSELRARIPLGRPAEPEEIAEIAVAILSDTSSYMTGSVVSVDGGVTAWYGI